VNLSSVLSPNGMGWLNSKRWTCMRQKAGFVLTQGRRTWRFGEARLMTADKEVSSHQKWSFQVVWILELR
jgi:hypothetical protein